MFHIVSEYLISLFRSGKEPPCGGLQNTIYRSLRSERVYSVFAQTVGVNHQRIGRLIDENGFKRPIGRQ